MTRILTARRKAVKGYARNCDAGNLPMTRRFLAWLVRPQFTFLTVAAWYLIGNLAAWNVPWWARLAIAFGIGVTQAVLRDLASWLLRRTASHAGS